jgi:DNA-binding transcriptional MerR regulator
MLIGELAASLKVTSKALRLYEQRGLIAAPARAGNGYRAYGADTIRRARLVVGLRAIGLSLNAIERLLGELDAPGGNLRRALAGVLDERISCPPPSAARAAASSPICANSPRVAEPHQSLA